jgi:uncharacterized protein YdaU (DUF1376 family)
LNYYRRYVGDYLRDTARLSMLEHGAYNLLLDHYYAEELPIPLDMGEVYTMVRAMTPVDRKAVDKVLAKYFSRQADGFHNARADKEIATSKQARTNGKGHTGKATGGTTGKVTEDVTGQPTEKQTEKPTVLATTEEGGSGHPPTTNHQPPASTHQPPSKNGSAAARRPRKDGEAKSGPAWEAFTEAYRERYHTDPTRNAVENAAMAAFVELVPLEEAPKIAAFYVWHNKAWYVSHQHSAKYLRQDAAGLRTQWSNGNKVTDTEARQADQTAARGDQAQRLLNKHGVAR